MDSESLLLQLTGLVYDAAADPSLWTLFLEKLADSIDADGTVLFATDPDAPGQGVSAMTRFDPELIQLYATDFADNIWSRNADAVFASHEIRYSQALGSLKELRRDRYYADFLSPARIEHSIGLKIPFGAVSPAYLATSRSFRKGQFGEREGGVLLALAPHIRRALELNRRLAGNLFFTELMDSLPTGIVFLSQTSRPIWWNRYAEEIFKSCDGLRMGTVGLETANSLEGERLRLMIRKAAEAEKKTSRSRSGGAMAVSRPSLRRSYAVLILPLNRSATRLRNAVVAMLITDPEHAPGSGESERLALQFGLTPGEGKIAARLAQGKSAKSIADELSLSLATVRAHIRSLLMKTSTTRQSELIRVLLTGPQLWCGE